jgi:hypothetical protein
MPSFPRKNLVVFSAAEIESRVTPRNKLSVRSYSFEFDEYGNLLKSDCPRSEQGIGYARLVEEARTMWEVNNGEG